jgi:sugar phosphate isomerase/epimerase
MNPPLLDADWNHWPDGLGPEETAAAAGRLGCDGLELGVYDHEVELAPDRLETWAAAGRRHGVEVRRLLLSLPPARWPAGALSSPDAAGEVLAQTTAAARIAADLGHDVLGVWTGADLPGADWAVLVDTCGRLAAAVRPLGVHLALEPKPDTRLGAPADVLRLTDESGTADVVGVLLDTGHELAAGRDPAALAGELGDRVLHVHLGDSRGDADDDLPPGRAHDLRPFVAALVQTGYRGLMTPDLYGWVDGGGASGVEAVRETIDHLEAAA